MRLGKGWVDFLLFFAMASAGEMRVAELVAEQMGSYCGRDWGNKEWLEEAGRRGSKKARRRAASETDG